MNNYKFSCGFSEESHPSKHASPVLAKADIPCPSPAPWVPAVHEGGSGGPWRRIRVGWPGKQEGIL